MDRSSALFHLKPVTMQPLAPTAFYQPDPTASNWNFSITNLKGINHPGSPEKEAINAIKEAKLIQKQKNPAPGTDSSEEGLSALSPVMFRNFQGNGFDGWYPPDNALAISDNGYIVSLINSNIRVYTENGSKLLDQPLGDFFSSLGLSDFIYDPKVIYDADQDKFIIVALHGNTPANSKIVVSFSKTQNPADGWWSYLFSGNFLNINTWFDFPSIGVSGEDLFISGNLFNSNDVFSQAVILQIDKQPGFTGGSINWEYFNNVTDGLGASSFTVVPVSYGFNGSYGPGIYLVSTMSGGGGYAHLYDITGNLEDEQDIFAYEIGTAAYSPPADAEQLLTTKLLDIGDCRVLGGFFADGVIHYIHAVDYGGGYGGIRYNRMDVTGQSITYVNYGQNLYDYGYPTLVPAGADNSDQSVLIAFLRSSKSSFPEFRAVSVDEAMGVSPSVELKGGEYFINITAENVQRWGDYAGACRKHSAANPIVWVSGCFGKLNSTYGTWIAELSLDPNAAVAEVENLATTSIFPNPVQDMFTLEMELREKTYLHIFLSDVNGRVVRSLFQGRVKGGTNRLSFNKERLTPGMYFLFIQDEQQRTVRQEKIVVIE
ncbi:MAG: T9SS type A sorting domain-containing protein [Saprospirales bacterium]|nr:T9SS type A sorting domain-containing protein [Saprospirales bacterium]